MTKTPTVYDVAQRAGVSIATVSFAFRKPERVRPTTREVVFAAAHELGYVPNASARGLAHGRTGALGLYSFDYLLEASGGTRDAGSDATKGGPDDDVRTFPLYVDEVQRGVELECWTRGYALMIGGGGVRGNAAEVTDIAGRVDGLAVFPQTVPLEVLTRIARRIPVVEVSEPSDGDGLDHVTVDNTAGMRALVTHLVEAHGLRDLLFIGETVSSDGAARFAGFRRALRGAGLRVPREPMTFPGDAEEQASAVVAELRRRATLPEALVCATDQGALAIMDALLIEGIKVPRQMRVTGFDGIVAGRLSRPTLTTVRQPMAELGRAAVELLVKRVENFESPPVHRQFPVEVVLRESCGCRTR